MPARHSRVTATVIALLFTFVAPVSASTPPPSFTVIDLFPGTERSYAMDDSNTVVLGDYIYFGALGHLYRSNGTTTDLVYAHDGGAPTGLLSYDGWVYYSAGDATHGRELWRTDGETTQLIDDINAGSDGSDPVPLIGVGDSLYFRATNGVDGYELWRVNTTTLMVGMVDNIEPAGDSWPNYPVVLGSYVYFSATTLANGSELWRTNGVGAELVSDTNVGAGGAGTVYLQVLGDWVYFNADDGSSGNELWRTNGTTVEQVLDVCDGSGGSEPTGFDVFGSYLYFTANDCVHGRELWRTSGTSFSTELVGESEVGASGGNPRGAVLFNDWLYFDAASSATGSELWRSDGSTVELVADINDTATDSSYPEYFVPVGDWLYFMAYDGSQWGIWRTNGSATEAVPFPEAGQAIDCDCYDGNISTAGGKLFTTVESAAIGNEFAYLVEPTYVMPSTNRQGGDWSTVLAVLAGLTAVAGVMLRRHQNAQVK